MYILIFHDKGFNFATGHVNFKIDITFISSGFPAFKEAFLKFF